MKKSYIIGIVVVVIVAIALAWFFVGPKLNSSPSGPPPPMVNITYNNIAQVMSGSGMVNAIPAGSEILLKFYSFKIGMRIWEKSFALTSGVMRETANPDEKADIIISLDSKYLQGLNNYNFCSMIQQANTNGDLGFESDMSSVALAWKFKSMYQYRSCFGF
jgi:hypothetical protein